MVKLQIPAGKATPAPPVGTALGPQGVNIMEFCKAFNAKTSAKDQEGLIIPVVITIFSDRSFTFITKTPPVPVLIKRAVGIAKGSAEPNKNRVGKITLKQVEEIAKIKMPDLNCFTVEAAMNSVKGTARSMGVDVSLKASALTSLPQSDNAYRWRFEEHAGFFLLGISPLCAGQGSAPPGSNGLADRSLEELMNIEVTSVSKKAQRLSSTAASVFVITSEDIRRSGLRIAGGIAAGAWRAGRALSKPGAGRWRSADSITISPIS